MSDAEKVEVNGNGVHTEDKIVILDAGAQYGKVTINNCTKTSPVIE